MKMKHHTIHTSKQTFKSMLIYYYYGILKIKDLQDFYRFMTNKTKW